MYAAAEEPDVGSVPKAPADHPPAHGSINNQDNHTTSHLQHNQANAQPITAVPIAPRPTLATNVTPASNDGPQAYGTQMNPPNLHQSNTNLGAVYLGPLTYDLQGNVLAHGSNNNLQAGPVPVLPDPMLRQLPLPQSHNWPPQVYPGPMLVFNPATGQYHQPVEGFHLPPLVPHQEHNNAGPSGFLPYPNYQSMPPDHDIFNLRAVTLHDNQAAPPTTAAAPLPLNNPNLNPNPDQNLTLTPGPFPSEGMPKRRPATYGTGERGRRNARLHAQGLCIWCQKPNPNLRRKGCPACLPRRAATTARWRKMRERGRWGVVGMGRGVRGREVGRG
ncbi:hypothetical protein B0I37DRAFT_358258 [Chaetomium sp. MPI-CAGE-AT-0009]|nr:hypothetical protein B0I37DRAFT_358258 [Chaetomium sp. MPI-CAGE-AT-0009]